MTKSKQKIIPVFLKTLLLVIGIGFGLLALVMIEIVLTDFALIGLIGAIMFMMFSSGSIFFGIRSLRTVVADKNSKSIDLVLFGIFRQTIFYSDIKGICSYPFTNNLGSYDGLLIELLNGQQIQFSAFDIRNFEDLKTELLEFIPTDNQLKLNIWTSFAKTFVIICLALVLIMLLGKLTGWI